MADLRTGNGWRVGWRSDQGVYPALLGSDHWAVELTAAEFESFCDLLRQLTQQLEIIRSELMPEEQITLTSSNAQVHLNLEGYPYAYGLHLILLRERRAEGSWPAPLAPEFLLACLELHQEQRSGKLE